MPKGSLFFSNNRACHCNINLKVALKGQPAHWQCAGGAPEKPQAHEQQLMSCRQDPTLQYSTSRSAEKMSTPLQIVAAETGSSQF